MKPAVPIAFVTALGCGGGSSKPVEKPVEEPPKKVVTRVPIEDESEAKDDVGDGEVTFTKTKGSITKEEIEAGLAPHSTALGECYTSKVGKRRWLGGEVILQWNLEADGKVSSVKLIE